MKHHLVCKTCSAILSKPVEIIDNSSELIQRALKDPNDFCYDVIPEGYACYETESANKDIVPKGWSTENAYPYGDVIWLNFEDILADMTVLTSNHPCCCGPVAQDGANTSCKCGSIIGAEQTECVAPWVFIAECKYAELKC